MKSEVGLFGLTKNYPTLHLTRHACCWRWRNSSLNGNAQENFKQWPWPQERSAYWFVDAKKVKLSLQERRIFHTLLDLQGLSALARLRLLLKPSSMALKVLCVSKYKRNGQIAGEITERQCARWGRAYLVAKLTFATGSWNRFFVPLFILYIMKASQRSLANFLWVGYYNHVWVASDKISRASLDEGATKGSALFLQGIPSSAFFRFDDRNFKGQLRAFLALSPAPQKIWKHKCDNGKTLFLSGREQAMHLFHCKQQGRAIHAHSAGLDQLRDCHIAANFGHSWRLEKRLSNPEDGTSWCGSPPERP